MKENRKIVYTKSVIKESLFELLETKELSKITVKELCGLADINRSTFYSHYEDVYDLVQKIEDHIFESVMSNINIEGIQQDSQQALFEEIFFQLKKNKSEVHIVYLNPESGKCFERIFNKVYEYASRVLKAHFVDLSDAEIKHVYSYISRGGAGIVASWLENGMLEEPKDMASLMIRSLKGDFYY